MPRSLIPRFAVTDARGVRVPLRTLRDRRLGLEDDDRSAQLKRILKRRFLWHGVGGGVIGGLVGGVVPPLIAAAFRSRTTGPGPLTDILLAAAIMLPLLLVPIVILRLLATRSSPRVALEFLRLGHCPACAYDLDRTEPDADGITTCPECGAAWREVQRPADRPVSTDAPSAGST